jgi:D-hydroxyproline dehydrogenase
MSGERIAVIGAGVIGLAIAVTLQRRGRRVILMDQARPGSGCSAGNAAVIATSFVLPLSNVEHLLGAPRMLLDPLGPLAIRSQDLPSLIPWLARFVLNALPRNQRRTIDTLKAINIAALPAWRRLLRDLQASELLIERGMIEVVRPGRPADLKALFLHAERLAGECIAITRLGPNDVDDLEPVLAARAGAGLLHDGVAHVRDPAEVNSTMLEAFLGTGGEVLLAGVDAMAPCENHVAIFADGAEQHVDRAIVSAGFGSGELLRHLGLRVPIGVERGYHHMVRLDGPLPSRPISFHAEGFLATPLASGLRLAGTVELAKAEAAPNWRRADQLPLLARRYLGEVEPDGKGRWMGCRPSFADGLPAIGQLRGAPRLLYAFGHQHLGLTQAATTAESVAAIVTGLGEPPFLKACSLDRFNS